ncbi:MAG: hypothetical protein HYX75_05990 [Acidobacteria bacterium]|nr:hypothetical protein [Acidobacteriota bacterium]
MSPAERVLTPLAHHGLLLKQDRTVPSVVGIITGESLRTSWWSHPKARLIFAVLSELSEHPDVLFTKLLYRKDTLIHRSLWPVFLAIARTRDQWQLEGLSAEARALLGRIDQSETEVRASGAPIKELEVRLLARTHEIHTESGRHEMVAESWLSWSARVGCVANQSPPDARRTLEQAVITLGAPLRALPWLRPNKT